MADCPKCGRHLRLADWKQKCPSCGANVFLYDLQERLMQDADIAEVQHYHFQKKLDRAKASFIGTPLAVVRFIVSLLPVGAVFLPLLKTGAGAANLPETVDAMKLYDYFSNESASFFAGVQTDPAGRLFAAALGCLVISLVMWLLHLLLLFLACSPHGKSRCFTLASLEIVFGAAFVLLILFFPESAFASAAPGIGAWLYLLLSVANLIVEILVFRQGIPIEHKQCYVGGIPIEEYFEMVASGTPPEEIRAEQYRRLTALQKEKERALEEEEAGRTAQRGKEATNGG